MWKAEPMKYVVFDESAEDVASQAPPHFPAHQAWDESFHAHGDLLLIGAFGDPHREGSMAVFRTRDTAEEFTAGDPFVRDGVVRSRQIRDWNEALG